MLLVFTSLILSIILKDVYPARNDLESQCSPYHFVEQSLAKTVRLEVLVEELIRNKNSTDNKFNANLETLRIEIEKLKTRLDEEEEEKAIDSAKCPSTYMYNEETNLCWRLEKYTKQHWFDARKTCTEEGAQLMILKSSEEISVVQEYLRAEDANIVFVGASDILHEGTYKWISGEHMLRVPWGSGQPSRNRVENCLVMYKGWDYSFGDDHCHGKYQFLCQKKLK